MFFGEWKYAAQGTDGRTYPWGNEWDAAAVPAPDKRRRMREPTNVDAYPKGASPFGVMDLVGNVWQWTDEFVDEHTRASILKGGSLYQPQGSLWHFPQAYKFLAWRLTEGGDSRRVSACISRIFYQPQGSLWHFPQAYNFLALGAVLSLSSCPVFIARDLSGFAFSLLLTFSLFRSY
jgi:formylglycine-generating enzyme required for sulfatase activity